MEFASFDEKADLDPVFSIQVLINNAMLLDTKKDEQAIIGDTRRRKSPKCQHKINQLKNVRDGPCRSRFMILCKKVQTIHI